jgi:hypothetical protein
LSSTYILSKEGSNYQVVRTEKYSILVKCGNFPSADQIIWSRDELAAGLRTVTYVFSRKILAKAGLHSCGGLFVSKTWILY